MTPRPTATVAIWALACCMADAAMAADPPVSQSPPPSTVDAIVVRAKARPVQTTIDRKIYTVDGDLQAQTGSAADILNDIPSVEVDADGNVALRGDNNVTILVDGKPSAQFSGATAGLALTQFPANEIERIEVMTNPPPQYKVEGAGGVINIITKKTRKAGLSGSAQLSLGDKRRYVAAANINDTLGKLTLSAGVSLRQEFKQRIVTDSRAAVDPASQRLILGDETIRESLRRLTPLVKAAADYKINDRQSIGVSMSHQELTGHRYFSQHDDSAAVDGTMASITDRYSDGHEWNKDTGQEVHFDQKLWRPDETLTLSYQRTVERERERYAYTNTSTTPPASPTYDDLRLNLNIVTNEASAEYDLPLPHDRDLKLGYDFEDDNDAFDNVGDTVDPATGALNNDPNVTNSFRYHQQVQAGYGSYQTSLGHLSVLSGLRLEQVDADALLITGGLSHVYGYFRAYPSLHVDYALTDAAKISFSASRRVTRPDPELLNPFADHQDIYNLRAGDPNLLPQDTLSYELGYSYEGKPVNFSVTGYYRFNRDPVTDVVQVVSADVLLITKANLPKSKSAGLEFTTSGRLLSNITVNLSGNLFYNQIDAGTLGLSGLQSTIGFNAKVSVDYRVTRLDTLQVSFSRSDKRLTPQGYVGAINLVNFGCRHQFSPSLTAVATLSDAFDGQTFRRYVVAPNLTDTYQRQQLGRIAYLGLVYTFGASKKAKAPTFEYEQ